MAKTRKLFLCINSLLMLIGMAGIIFMGQGLARAGEIINALVVPELWLIIGMILLGAIFAISFIGVIGIIRRSRASVCLFLFLNISIMIAIIVIAVPLFLFVNNQAGEATEIIENLQSQLEETMFVYSYDEPEDWLSLQLAFNCCGVDMEKTYQPPLNGLTLSAQLSGPRCNLSAIQIFQEKFPVFNEEAQIAVDADPKLGKASNGYFCVDQVLGTAREQTPLAAGIVAAIVGFQFLSCYLVFYIFCFLEERYGGFAVINEETEFRVLSSNDLFFGMNSNRQPSYQAQDDELGGLPNNFSSRSEPREGIMSFGNRMSKRMGFTPIGNTSRLQYEAPLSPSNSKYPDY